MTRVHVWAACVMLGKLHTPGERFFVETAVTQVWLVQIYNDSVAHRIKCDSGDRKWGLRSDKGAPPTFCQAGRQSHLHSSNTDWQEEEPAVSVCKWPTELTDRFVFCLQVYLNTICTLKVWSVAVMIPPVQRRSQCQWRGTKSTVWVRHVKWMSILKWVLL